MPETLIPVDLTKAPADQPVPLHNRWHPEIPPVVSVRPGAVFRVECLDWTGGQIGNNDSANDVRDVDLLQVHYLSGPIRVEGAEPGDLLVVDILDFGPLPGAHVQLFAQRTALPDRLHSPKRARRPSSRHHARSRHLLGVYAGIPPGADRHRAVPAVADRWNRRERELIARDPNVPRSRCPTASALLAGQGRGVDRSPAKRRARRAARTAATATSRTSRAAPEITSLPVPGANLSRATCTFAGRRRDHVLRRDRDGGRDLHDVIKGDEQVPQREPDLRAGP